MKIKYKGVLETHNLSFGNKDCIYEEQEDGTFLCIEGVHKGNRHPKKDIEHDFEKGFLIRL